MISSIIAGVIISGVVTPQLKHAFAANAATVGTADHHSAIVGGGRTHRNGGGGIDHRSQVWKDTRRHWIVKFPEATTKNLKYREEPFDVRESQEQISASLKELSPPVVVYATRHQEADRVEMSLKSMMGCRKGRNGLQGSRSHVRFDFGSGRR